MRHRVLLILSLALVIGPRGQLLAQQVTTQMPFQTHGTRFFEQSNIGWSIQSPNYFVSFNGGGATPPFGGFQPNAGLSGGFTAGNTRLNFNFAQGASSTSSTIAVFAKNSAALDPFRGLSDVRELDAKGVSAWTDDFSDILGPFLSKMKISD